MTAIPVPPEPPEALPERGETWPVVWQFRWLTVPLLAPLLVYAFVAPDDLLPIVAVGTIATVVITRIGALVLVVRRPLRPRFSFAIWAAFRDVLGLIGLAALYVVGVAVAVMLVSPAIGYGSRATYARALETGKPNNFTPAQVGVLIHTIALVPMVMVGSVVLLKFRGDLRRPLVLPRLARRLHSLPRLLRLLVSVLFCLLAGVLVSENGGLNIAQPPAGAICEWAPTTCHDVKKLLKERLQYELVAAGVPLRTLEQEISRRHCRTAHSRRAYPACKLWGQEERETRRAIRRLEREVAGAHV